jgi:chromosome partitioning protein
MPVVAVVNRKGGSGKSTFASHLAAWCAHEGLAVMLGDVDRQQSSRSWLRRRDPSLPVIAPWVIDQKNVLRVPSGITHVVLDTPGGLHGFELQRIVMFADAIVMPVCPSVFDRESAAACIAELAMQPRIAKGQCRIATVGMRVDLRSKSPEILRAWAQENHVDMVGMLRETNNYLRCAERGLTLFDVPREHAPTTDLTQWSPILQWLRPVLMPPPVPEARREPVLPVRRPSVLGTKPANEPARMSVLGGLPMNEAGRLALGAATERSLSRSS